MGKCCWGLSGDRCVLHPYPQLVPQLSPSHLGQWDRMCLSPMSPSTPLSNWSQDRYHPGLLHRRIKQRGRTLIYESRVGLAPVPEVRRPRRELLYSLYTHPTHVRGQYPLKQSYHPTIRKKSTKFACPIWRRLEAFSCIPSSLPISPLNQLPACCCGNQAVLLHPAKAVRLLSLGEWSSKLKMESRPRLMLTLTLWPPLCQSTLNLRFGIEMYGLNTSVALVGDWDIGDHSGNSETEYQEGSFLVGVTGLGSSKTLCFSYI